MVHDNVPLGRQTPIAGVTEIRGILGLAVSNLGARIVGGEWGIGEVIAKESDLIEELGVGRSVVREACRILSAKGLIRSRTSDGTRVLPRERWRLLDPDVMDWRIQAGQREDLLRDLLNFRLVFEPGIAYSATLLADVEQQEVITRAWQAKEAAYHDTDSEPEQRRRAIIETDVAFHQAFASAVNSDLMNQLFAVISSALELLFDHQIRARGYAQTTAEMDNSHELHARVYRAFMDRNPAAAEAAMRVLIGCAIEDAELGFAQIAQKQNLAQYS